jgi:RNA recognition motif-containing protein
MVKLFQTKYEHKQYLQNSTQRINEQNANCNLIIKNIPLTAKEEDLIKIFSKYGSVTSVRIEKNKIEKKDEKGKFELVSKGFGYLSFDNPEAAKSAMENLNGKYLPGFEAWSRTLIIELFMPRHERQFVESQEFSQNYFMNPQNTPKGFQNYNYMRPYPPYPYNYLPPGGMYPPAPIPPYGNFGNNSGFKRKRGNKNYFYGNRNNNYKNSNYNKNNEKKKYEQTTEEPKNKFDLTEYNKLETMEDKKDFLGEKIFKAIQESPIASERKVDMETIGRITGMIIELPDHKEIIENLENPSVLNSRIEEAFKLLNWKA